jgi:hypothetical protein
MHGVFHWCCKNLHALKLAERLLLLYRFFLTPLVHVVLRQVLQVLWVANMCMQGSGDSAGWLAFMAVHNIVSCLYMLVRHTSGVA